MILMINIHFMKRIITGILAAAVLSLFFISCSSEAKDSNGKNKDLNVQLEKLKKEKSKVDAEIKKMEEQIAKADPQASQQVKKLISVDTLRTQDFVHYIELQGKIDADGIAYAAPTGMGGQVKAVYVKQGSRVHKGQLIVKLDDALVRQAVEAAQLQTGQLKTRIAQAQTVYERYKSLWDQNIGAEIQVINAKADVDALTAQLKAAEGQIGIAQEQAKMANVYAQISGVIDEMNVKPGEFFSPQTAAQPGMGIRIVNSSSLKIVTGIPENYITRVKQGNKVQVVIAESGKPPFNTVLSTVGASIDAKTRSFTSEARLPADPLLKPNQTATLKILDYESKNAVAVSINVVQSDEKNKYVFVMVKEGDKMIARKKTVIVGEAYGGLIEIKKGLTANDLIITEGYQTVYDGQSVTTDGK
jgi:RND family efflux transporter MFP subunit